MTFIGRIVCAAIAMVLSLGTTYAVAAAQATLDRDRIALGDTLTLTITATNNDDLSEASLDPLFADFEVLQRSSSSNTNIVNGRISRSRQLIIEMTPKRQGDLTLPSLEVGNSITAAIPVTVGPPASMGGSDETVVFEMELDHKQVYVQSQVILTLRVSQAINLERRNISEFTLNNAFVKPLEQRSFQTRIDGRQWRVDEIRYAIFPEQSGTLEIPQQVFSGRVTQRRRSLFDIGGNGQRVRRIAGPISIEVLPIPAAFVGDNWLPARNVTVEESWSSPPERLGVGESATRTIRITAEGAQGAQLPPIRFKPVDGLKYYPDQPSIGEEELPSGLLGIREDNAAVVPTRAGTYTIPELRIPWWDTQNRALNYAVVPAREIVAALPAGSAAPATTIPLPVAAAEPSTSTLPEALPPGRESNPLWPTIAAVTTTGWLLTLFYLWRSRRTIQTPNSEEHDSGSEKQTFKALLAACRQEDALAARGAMLAWSATLFPDAPPRSLEQVSLRFADGELAAQLDALDSGLFGSNQTTWSGPAVATRAKQLRSQYKKKPPTNRALALYPSPG